MTYVDSLRDYGWRLGPSCHLFADTEEELHAFARRIGLQRRWAQVSRKGVRHYDLTASKRVKALESGAVEADRDTLRRLIMGGDE